ncbi:MAG: CDP-alcohol phosphatidyltransferase family protein [Chthoniobacterales bacterium]
MVTFAAMQVVIRANAPQALTKLCGVSLLERLLRILRRLDIEQVTIVSRTTADIRAVIERPSWARRGLTADVINEADFQPAPSERLVSLPGNFYFDARLINALCECDRGAVLIDRNPPAVLMPLLPDGYSSGATVGDGQSVLDAGEIPSYVIGMRRDIRPVFFPAPAPEQHRRAERIILDAAQNGTLDLPAIVHAPIETWIISWLCRTPITPNQITASGGLLSLGAAVCFITGRLSLGMSLALIFGIIDGLDGKQARVKIETTKAGKLEHALDFVLETTWCATLAFWLARSGGSPHAWRYFAVLLVADIVDRIAKTIARKHIPVLLDDFSPFDRFVRLIGARRNVYIWILAIGLVSGAFGRSYEVCACWGAITALLHVVRAVAVSRGRALPAR